MFGYDVGLCELTDLDQIVEQNIERFFVVFVEASCIVDEIVHAILFHNILDQLFHWVFFQTAE